jgi:hypothetical protein
MVSTGFYMAFLDQIIGWKIDVERQNGGIWSQ